MSQTTPPADTVRFGLFELDVRAGELRKRGVRVPLQGLPVQVLNTLLENPAHIVTRDDLRTRLWPADTFVDFDHSLHNAIARLREALGETANSPRFVETLPRRGYRFIGAVETPSAPPVSSSETLKSGRLRRAFLAVSLIFLATGAVLVGLNIGGLRSRWFGKQVA